jgi:hypothetical protein
MGASILPGLIGAEAPPLSDKSQERVGSSLTCDEQRALPNIHALEMAEEFLRFDWACDPELVNASHKTTTKHERMPGPTEDRAMYVGADGEGAAVSPVSHSLLIQRRTGATGLQGWPAWGRISLLPASVSTTNVWRVRRT